MKHNTLGLYKINHKGEVEKEIIFPISEIKEVFYSRPYEVLNGTHKETADETIMDFSIYQEAIIETEEEYVSFEYDFGAFVPVDIDTMVDLEIMGQVNERGIKARIKDVSIRDVQLHVNNIVITRKGELT